MSYLPYVSAFNVKSYGAAGDGSTDDTGAIQDALDAVPAFNPSGNVPAGGLVYFPQGNYLISKPLVRKQPNTACLGAGKASTFITLDQTTWNPVPSIADPSGKSYMLDLSSMDNTDCTVSDMTLEGQATTGPVSNTPEQQCGILVAAREVISRVSLYDIWGYGLWIFGAGAEYAKVLDCEAWKGMNPNSPAKAKGNDCIGGGGQRVLIERFHWTSGMDKNTALDFITGGGSSTAEVSVDLIDCLNESFQDIRLEGCILSSVRSCRFYGNLLLIHTNAHGAPLNLYNPLDIIVEGNTFYGLPGDLYSGLKVSFTGGPDAPVGTTTHLGGRIAVIGNDFVNCDVSAILWSGDTADTSVGGSIISGNRIYDPNQTGGPDPTDVLGDYGELQGKAVGSGISVLTSAGLTIQGNTILDQSGKMQYSMQLVSASTPPHSGNRILVQGNLCGSSPGVGNGTAGTFYLGNPTAANPSPILLNNTNQPQGYDGTAAGVVPNNVPWPAAGGYPYNAFICVQAAGAINFIEIGGVNTGLTAGSFYVPVGQTFTIKWSGVTPPSIKVFQS